MYYAMAGISELEIPKEKSLVIYISECQNRCLGCHTPFLHYKYGDRLIDNFEDIFYLYYDYFDVLCLLGEGKCGIEEKNEINYYCEFAHKYFKKFALYSGRDCEIEDWMKNFDYVKLGAYKEKFGPLTSKNTNQVLYKKSKDRFINITSIFWN